MTSFEKMKYLHRNAGKKAEAEPSAVKKTAKKAAKRNIGEACCTGQEEGKGEADEE